MTLALDHVQIAMPAGREAEARAFFGDLLGLPELLKPENQSQRGGCWFALADRELHLGVDPDFRPAKKAHVALKTDDLAGLRAQLDAAGYPTRDDIPVEGRSRFFTEDPFGNRLELLQLDAR
jgi:catechol 2,3-dioxygenase-like lactoylglutathione lyase family enzyme